MAKHISTPSDKMIPYNMTYSSGLMPSDFIVAKVNTKAPRHSHVILSWSTFSYLTTRYIKMFQSTPTHNSDVC